MLPLVSSQSSAVAGPATGPLQLSSTLARHSRRLTHMSRFTHACIAISGVFALAGCRQQAPPATANTAAGATVSSVSTVTPPAHPTRSQVVDSSTSDAQVLALVLGDLMTYPGEDNPVSGGRSFPEHLLIANKLGAFGFASYPPPSSVDLRLSAVPQCPLTPVEVAAANDAGLDSEVRMARGSVAFPELHLDPARFVIAPPASSPDGITNRQIQIFAPGYSSDGQIAVVQMSIPWSIHSASGIYVLARTDAAWVVRMRWFQIHP